MGKPTPILVTGFEPFGSWSVNPSELVVQALAADTNHPLADRIATQVLPTEYQLAAEQLRATIKRVRPGLVLCLGLTSQRDRICLERFALNIDDVTARDNANSVREDTEIEPGGPPAVKTVINLKPMLHRLLAADFKAEISNHAGTYVCNHVYYQMLRALQDGNDDAIGVFVHLPMVAQGEPMAELNVAVNLILDELVTLEHTSL